MNRLRKGLTGALLALSLVASPLMPAEAARAEELGAREAITVEAEGAREAITVEPEAGQAEDVDRIEVASSDQATAATSGSAPSELQTIAPQDDIDFSAIKYTTSLSFDGQIVVNLYAKQLPAGTKPADYRVRYWLGDDESDAVEQSLEGTDFGHVTLATLGADQMTEPIHARVYYRDGAEPLKSIDYSVRQYCDKKIGTSESECLRNLCQATLDYGTYAQRRTGNRIDDLANANHGELTEQAVASVVIPEEHAETSHATRGFDAKVLETSVSADIDSQAALSLLVTPLRSVGADAVDITVDGVPVTEGASDGAHRETLEDGSILVRLPSTAARELDHRYQIVVSVEGESKTIECSVLSYAYAQQGSDVDELGATCKALYNYWLAANAALK